LFLFLSLLRPLIKALWPLDGLVWLPLLAAGITLALYPAYGFRPESAPLLIFEILLILLNIPAMASSAGSRPSDEFRDRGIVFTVSGLVLLAAAGAVLFIFSPEISPPLADAGVRTVEIRDEARDRVYFLRIYHPSGDTGKSPPLFLVPPEAGSVPAVDGICAGLRDRGFTVISYSRRGFDFPALGDGGRRYYVSPSRVYMFWSAFRGGVASKAANDRGRSLEAARQEDIEFLLPHVTRLRETAGLPLILAGYGSGGAALVYLADSPAFRPWAASVKGIIAVETGLWRTYRAEERQPRRAPEGAGWFLSAWTGVQNWLDKVKPLETGGFDPAPRPAVPVLYLVSDRVWDQRPGKNRYGAVLETLRNSLHPMALVSLDGAGPLDYTGYPLSHPVYAALFPGRGKTAWGGADLMDVTVMIMANFAAMLPEPPLSAGTAGPEPDEYRGSRRVPAEGSGAGIRDLLRIETRSWNLPDLRYILAP
jgi:hypothetical protein